MKLFEINMANMVLRYYLMMAIVIVAGFSGQWWLAILSFPVFLSAMLGIKFKAEDKASKTPGKVVRLEEREGLKKAA